MDRDFYRGFHGRFGPCFEEFRQWALGEEAVAHDLVEATRTRIRNWQDGTFELLRVLARCWDNGLPNSPEVADALANGDLKPTARNALRNAWNQFRAKREAAGLQRGDTLAELVSCLVDSAFVRGFVGPLRENHAAHGLDESTVDARLAALKPHLDKGLSYLKVNIIKNASLAVRKEKRPIPRVSLVTPVPIRLRTKIGEEPNG